MKTTFAMTLCAASALLFACDPHDDSHEHTDGGAPDAVVVSDGGADASTAPCTQDEEGRCELITWQTSTPFVHAVDHHTTFIHESPAGAYLYVVGGQHARLEEFVDGSPWSTIHRAKINADGSLGMWELEQRLGSTIFFHALAQNAQNVYLIGGLTGDDTEVGGRVLTLILDFDDFGHVHLRVGPRLPVLMGHATAAIIGNRVFAIGGLTSSGGRVAGGNVVISSEINPTDGSLGDWEENERLPEARTHHAMLVHDNRLYLFGGMEDNLHPGDAYMSVLRSMHDADGKITGWTEVGAMEHPTWTSSAIEIDNYVYIVGGGEGEDTFTDRVQRAPLLADGAVGAFEDVAGTLPLGRAHVHQSPYFHGRIYSVGGRRFVSPSIYESIDAVFIGEVTSNASAVSTGNGATDPGAYTDGAQLDALFRDGYIALFDLLCSCASAELGYSDASECLDASAVLRRSEPDGGTCLAQAFDAVGVNETDRCTAQKWTAVRELVASVDGTCDVDAINESYGTAAVTCPSYSEEQKTQSHQTFAACARAAYVGTGADTCVPDAATIGAGTHTGTTLLAGDHRVGSCDTDPTLSGPDVALRFEAPSAGTYRFSTKGSGFDTVVYVLPDDCTGAELACNDNEAANKPYAVLSLSMTAGQIVRVIVDGIGVGQAGDYTLTITGP